MMSIAPVGTFSRRHLGSHPAGGHASAFQLGQGFGGRRDTIRATSVNAAGPRPLGNHQSLVVLSGSIFVFLLCTFKVRLVSLHAKLTSWFLTEVFGCGMGDWQQAVLIGGTMFALIFMTTLVQGLLK